MLYEVITDFRSIIRTEMPWWEMAMGLVEIFILGWLMGATMASIYNFGMNRQKKKADTRYTDPVCGMSTEDPDSFIPYRDKERDYYFCSETCLDRITSYNVCYTKLLRFSGHPADPAG